MCKKDGFFFVEDLLFTNVRTHKLIFAFLGNIVLLWFIEFKMSVQ